MQSLQELVSNTREHKGQWLHVVSGTVPVCKSGSKIQRLGELRLMSAQVYQIVDSFINQGQKKKILQGEEVVTTVNVAENFQMRIHIYRQRGTLAFSGKLIPSKFATLMDLNFPEKLQRSFLKANRGLILIAGSRDSGRTRTLKALLDAYAKQSSVHIVSLEDSIEGSFPRYENSLISRRIYGFDVKDFESLEESLIKGDLNVLSVGEINNMDRLRLALNLSSRGILVIGTILGVDVEGVLMNLLNCFGGGLQFRMSVAEVLKGVYHRRTIQNLAGERYEIDESFVNYSPTRKHIRENHIQSVVSFMKTGGRSDCWDYSRSYQSLVDNGGLTVDEVPQKYR